MGEFKSKKSTTDFLDEFAGLVEFEEPVVVAAVEYEDVALGVRGHRNGLAKVLARRELQQVRHAGKRDFGDILNGRLALRKRRRERQNGESDRGHEISLHQSLLYNGRAVRCHCMRSSRRVEGRSGS